MPTGQSPRPPPPGPFVAPNFLPIEEAVAGVTFPVSKRELLEMVADGTVIFNGRNVDLQEIIADLNDDFFEDEEEFRVALENKYGAPTGEENVPGPTPTGPMSTWQSEAGPGAAAGPDEYLEPHGG